MCYLFKKTHTQNRGANQRCENAIYLLGNFYRYADASGAGKDVYEFVSSNIFLIFTMLVSWSSTSVNVQVNIFFCEGQSCWKV